MAFNSFLDFMLLVFARRAKPPLSPFLKGAEKIARQDHALGIPPTAGLRTPNYPENKKAL
jgi:hypothetical protein